MLDQMQQPRKMSYINSDADVEVQDGTAKTAIFVPSGNKISLLLVCSNDFRVQTQ